MSSTPMRGTLRTLRISPPVATTTCRPSGRSGRRWRSGKRPLRGRIWYSIGGPDAGRVGACVGTALGGRLAVFRAGASDLGSGPMGGLVGGGRSRSGGGGSGTAGGGPDWLRGGLVGAGEGGGVGSGEGGGPGSIVWASVRPVKREGAGPRRAAP